MLSDQPKCRRDLPRAETVILRQRHFGFQPELGLAICVLDVDMRARLLPREKIKPIPARAEDGGAHGPETTGKIGLHRHARFHEVWRDAGAKVPGDRFPEAAARPSGRAGGHTDQTSAFRSK